MRTPQLAEELEAVLVSGSATRRTDILNRVTDLFIYGAARYSPEQVDLFGDVMVRLLHGMEAGARARLAERLAPIVNAPANVIRLLALDDEIAVAASVLAQSERLAEDELLLIANRKGQAHLLTIARRQDLSAPVTDVLIARGDRDVLASVARNGDAQFSEAGRRRLLERTRGDAVPAVEPPQRFRIGPQDRPPSPGESEIYRYARHGKLEETAAALSIISGLPKDAVERTLLNPRAEAVLVLAKAAGLSSLTTEAILRLRAADCGMSAEDVAQAMAKFSRLPRDSARRVLNFFRIRLENPQSAAASTAPPALALKP
jgi:uncharacterized protein (DUF2336 family)